MSDGRRAPSDRATAAGLFFGRALDEHLELAELLQLRVHADELIEETLDLVRDPGELVRADLSERHLELGRQLQQARDPVHPDIRDATVELAVVADDVFGLTAH